MEDDQKFIGIEINYSGIDEIANILLSKNKNVDHGRLHKVADEIATRLVVYWDRKDPVGFYIEKEDHVEGIDEFFELSEDSYSFVERDYE